MASHGVVPIPQTGPPLLPAPVPVPVPRLSRLVNVCCGAATGTPRARYTITKLQKFDQYARTTTPIRHVAVILLTPLPSMLTSLIPALVPLQDPMLGVVANKAFWLHGFVVIALVSFGCVLQFRAPCHISHHDISNVAAVCIAVLASVQLSVIVALVGYLWRFPVPFSWATCFFFWVSSLVTASVAVLRGTLRKNGPVRAALVAYLPSFVVQSSQVIVYPAFSSLFEYTSESGQVVLTLLFPSIKYVFRSLVRELSRHLGEDAEEVTVSGIEICAAMYQSMVMQSTPSPYTTVLVIGVDVIQGLVAIYISMAKRATAVPLSDVVAHAKAIVAQQDCSVTDDELTPYATVKTSPLVNSFTKRVWRGFTRSKSVTPRERSPKSRSHSRSQSQSSKDKQVLTHALEIVQSAESILIVEYFEVSVPIMNAVFLLWSSQFASAVYNPKIRLYFYDSDLLGSAIQSLAVYTVLQLLSVVVMHVVLWRRFRVSATVLLAFVLEHHAWSLQGKLVGWLSAIFQLPVMHYGESLPVGATKPALATPKAPTLSPPSHTPQDAPPPPPPPWSHRLLAAFCGVGTLRARYSIAKLRDFDQYARTTSTSRHVAVILLTPLPSLLTSLLPTAIALQDPMLGVLENPGFLFHFFTTLGFISLGSVFQFRGSCGLSSRDISVGNALAIAVLTSLWLTVFVALLGYVWRFPVPFTWVVAYGPFVASLVAAHALVLQGKLGPNSTIKGPLLAFLPSYFIQGCQVVIYPAFSALFEMCDELGQVAMTLLFPVIKFVFRGIVRRVSSHLVDNAEEVAVSGVEICSAMYQSMIMQNTPSPYTTALVIGVDLVQGMFAIYVFMLQRSIVPLSDVVDTACAVVVRDPRQRERRISTDVELTAYATIKTLPHVTKWRPHGLCSRQRRVVSHVSPDVSPHVAPRLAAIVETGPPLRKPSGGSASDVSACHDENQLVTHALEIIQSAESILIMEYFEVSVPIVNGLFLLWSSQFETAIFNPKMRPYMEDPSLLGPALRSLALYTVLQFLSIVVMYIVMWRRFRVSATTLLAFVLERHGWAIQGKLVAWLLAIFQLPILHYGVDFKLKFDFTFARRRATTGLDAALAHENYIDEHRLLLRELASLHAPVALAKSRHAMHEPHVPAPGLPVPYVEPPATAPPWSHRLLALLCGVGTLRARYSIAKLQDFDHYAQTTCATRHIAVICLTPLPSLLASLLPTAITLQDPTLGVLQNPGFLVHCFVTIGFVAVGSVFQFRGTCGLSARDLSFANAVVIALLTSLQATPVVLLLGYVWRFPVPFTCVLFYGPFMAGLISAHALVLRRKLGPNSTIKGPLLAFLPSFFIQGCQVVIYPAFSALFEMCDELGQVAMTLLFPFIKFGFRRVLRRLSTHLGDSSEEVAVSGVEICSAMYQSMIMQNTPSPYTTVLVIGLDLVQGLFAIYVFMLKRSVVPLNDVVGLACTVLRCDPAERRIPKDMELTRYATVKKLPLVTTWRPRGLCKRQRRVAPRLAAIVETGPQLRKVSVATVGRNEKQLVTHALEIIQSAESILIMEYFEVSVPIVNALFLLWSSQFETSIFNPKTRPYIEDPSLLGPALRSLALYTVLQFVSVVVMYVVMWRRFRVSATTLLAFVLERHGWAIQGKLMSWLTTIFHMPILHYGIDFKLKFDFSVLPRRSSIDGN